ncbi:esterase [uncultured Croceitalea sp.]|uniref:alpha/beta hydrolase n=1 Tax=uncultured Croceitalea sp. TaxID=1798908 RepID=UPI0033061885
MKSEKKIVTYTNTNSYETLNSLTNKTKNIWIIFHGIGFLSRYFLQFFKGLNPGENYIIAPQAPSKYYLNEEYKYVGASWLTKEDTQVELANVLRYVDAVLVTENLPEDKNIIVFGFSQGVSIATRWVATRKLLFHKLILYAGGLPSELTKEHFEFIDYNKSVVKIIYGDSDEFLTDERLKLQKIKSDELFQENAEILSFKGRHEIKPEILKNFE